MIDINLVPLELRKKRKKSLLPGGVKIPIEVVIGSGGGLLMLLIVVHIGLLLTNFVKLSQHNSLKAQYAAIETDKNSAEVVITEMRKLQKRHKSLTGITSKGQIPWSQKLNIISDVLPTGVWLERLSYSEGVLFIQGSAISRQNNEMVNVHSFMANLKENETFLEHFTNLDLGSIQRRKISKTEVADFLITAQEIVEEEKK